MTNILYARDPSKPPAWLREREPENELRHVRRMMEMELLIRQRPVPVKDTPQLGADEVAPID